MAVAADQMIVARIHDDTGHMTEGLAEAGEVLYKGTMVFVDADGFDVAAAGGNEFAGIIRKTVDNSAGADGDLKTERYTEMDIELPGSGFTQATVGQPIYASDNYTVTTTSTSNSYVGTCTRYVSATKIEVRLEVGRRATGGG